MRSHVEMFWYRHRYRRKKLYSNLLTLYLDDYYKRQMILESNANILIKLQLLYY